MSIQSAMLPGRGSPGPSALRILLVLALLVTGPWTFVGCSSSDGNAANEADSSGVAESDSASSKAKPAKKEKAISVDVSEVQRVELVMPIYADGAIRTPRTLEIRTKLGGELVKVLVEDGDRVAAGQLLALIDQREYSLQLEESRYRHFEALSQVAAEADTFSANHDAIAQYVGKKQELENKLDERIISREEYQALLLELELSALNEGAFRQDVFEQRTGLAEARTSAARAELNLENTEIRSPFAGVVQGLTVVPGEIISVGTTICTLYNNDRLEAVVNVLEADLGDLANGRPVLLAIPAARDTLRVRVDVISPSLDEISRTCEVIIRFRNSEGRYRPGMFVRAEIAGWIHDDRLVVPKAAVLTRDNRPLVFKVNEDRAQWLYVDTGLENDSWVEILQVHSGGSLAPGDRVVVSDHLTLAHEAKIKIRRQQPPDNRWGFALENSGSGP